MADNKPTPPPRPTAISSNNASDLAPTSGVRNRVSQWQSSHHSLPPSPKPSGLLRRRSSILSYSSFEDATQELINPRTGRRRGQEEDHEVTHWHSTPLAFAILPALGGLLFKNGSAFVTDALLLGLAAIFMNWSIRLPWDWYYSAQAVRQEVEPNHDDTIPEEPEDDEVALETTSSGEGSPEQPAKKRKSDQATAPSIGKREEAAAGLRKQELWALLATFVFPALAAYLLHVIRAQLSRPSMGLVSDYNLTIFLLAAEIRPCRQLVRLMASRTLHLQRAVTGLEKPFASAICGKGTISDLTSRLADLEARLSNYTILPPTVTIAQKADVSDLSAEMRKRYEPRLESLERAVRRYEKRTTTLTMLTEQRLQNLETRLQDALSLAAVAAQHSQRRSIFAYVLEAASAVFIWPMKIAWSLCVWPFLAVEGLYENVKVALLGPYSSRPKKTKHRSGDGSMDEKSRPKSSLRKTVR